MRALEGNRAAVDCLQVAEQLGQRQRMGSTPEMNQIADGFVQCESIHSRIEFSDERRVDGVPVERIDRRLAVAMQAISFHERLSPAGETEMRRLVPPNSRALTPDRFRL